MVLVAQLARPRTRHAAARLLDGRVLVVGGNSPLPAGDGTFARAADEALVYEVLASAEIFDPEFQSVAAVGGAMSARRAGASATTLIDGRVLIAGGYDSGQHSLDTADLFDPHSDASPFEQLPTRLSVARSGHSALLLPHNNSVLIAGGSSAGAPVTDVDLFLPAEFPDPYSYSTGSFAATAPMPVARARAIAGPRGDNGFAYVAGGGAGRADVYRFATIKTDKDDYAPGEKAVITGSGWQPNAPVTLVFQEDPAVHEDYVLTLVADANGELDYRDWSPDLHDLGVLFYLTAKQGEHRAQTKFWDGNLNGVTVSAPHPYVVSAGTNVSYTVTPGFATGGQPCTTTLAVSGLPANAVSLGFTPSNTVGSNETPGTRALTIQTAGVASGTYSFTVTASTSGCGNPRSTTGMLRVGKYSTQLTWQNDNPDPSTSGQLVTARVKLEPAAGQTIVAGTPAITAVTTGPGAGTITVSDGVDSCIIPVAGTTGNGECTLALSTPGVRTLNAMFSGNDVYAATGPVATPHTVITSGTAPAITSGGSAAFTYGSAASFTVTTTGTPVAAVSVSGALPSGVTFTDNGNGTGALSGTPLQTGTFSLTFTAANGVGANAAQAFALTVNKATAAVTLSNLNQAFNGSPRPVTATANPQGLAVDVTYDGYQTAPTDAGSYAIVATIDDANYQGSAGGTLVVTRAAVTITAGGGSGTFNGELQVPSDCVVSGVYQGQLTCTNDVDGVGPAAGQTTIHPVLQANGENPDNFEVTPVDGSYTIGRAWVTATAGSGSGTYNGQPQLPSACVVSGNFKGALTCANTPASVGPSVGTTTVTAVVVANGELLTNFEIATVAGSYEISAARVTITAGSGAGTYNGEPQTPSPCVVSGDYKGELTCDNAPASVGPNVGTTAIVPAAVANGEDLNNFAITVANGSYQIEPAKVIARAGGGSHTFDGTSRFPAACEVSGEYTGALTCSNDAAQVGPDAGSTTIRPVVNANGESLTNYLVTSVDAVYEIARAPVTLTAGNGTGTYNGQSHTPSDCVVSGAYTGKLACINTPGTVGPNVGTTLIEPTVGANGEKLENFVVSVATGAYEIKPAPVTAKAGAGLTTYDGSTHTPSACVLSGDYTGDLTCANAPAVVGPDAGGYTVEASVTGTGLSNFEITKVAGTFTIERAPVTITAGGGSGTYNGETHPPSACAVSGTYTGDLSCANSPSVVGPGAGTTLLTPVAAGSGLTNFIITPVTGSYTIHKAAVTATAGSGSAVFTGEMHTPSPCVLGGAYLGQLVCQNNPTPVGPAVGTVVITPVVAGPDLVNFNVTAIQGSFAIRAWQLSGFYQPVDMNGVLNVVKAGSTVPFKFEVFAGSGGAEKTSVAAIKSFTQQQVACGGAALQDEIEVTTTGGTTLRYDAVAGQFIQNWQTPKLPGTCYVVVMTTQDLSTLAAYFKLK